MLALIYLRYPKPRDVPCQLRTHSVRTIIRPKREDKQARGRPEQCQMPLIWRLIDILGSISYALSLFG